MKEVLVFLMAEYHALPPDFGGSETLYWPNVLDSEEDLPEDLEAGVMMPVELVEEFNAALKAFMEVQAKLAKYAI